LARNDTGKGALERHSAATPERRKTMLRWAIIFAVVALVAGLLGFTGIAGAAAGVAKILFFLFLAVVAFFVIAGLFAGRKITGG
jgi:uncharacterized membrane protein YtjA (UPF0391 family)